MADRAYNTAVVDGLELLEPLEESGKGGGTRLGVEALRQIVELKHHIEYIDRLDLLLCQF